MINYNFLSRLLHKLSLSHSPVRQASFNFEQYFLKKSFDTLGGKHVYIIGLARGGTTALLNTIHQSGNFASLTYSDMPFVMAPNLWQKLNIKSKSSETKPRFHEDGLNISLASPEAFEEVFWRTFENESEVLHNYSQFLFSVLNRYQKDRYLCKNNQNIHRMGFLHENLHESRFLVIYRKPLGQAFSLLTQHKKFLELTSLEPFIGNYMTWLGHTEFGPAYKPLVRKNLSFPDESTIEHWMEQWLRSYKAIFEKYGNKSNIKFLCYETLHPESSVWKIVADFLEVSALGQSFRVTDRQIETTIDNDLLKNCEELYTTMKERSV